MKKIIILITCIIGISNSLFGQNNVISGTITDLENTALPGANIMIKGTNTGVVSDMEGKYQISAKKNDTLVFSFIGYLKETVPVNDQSEINITMVPDIESIDEVVVVGYGSMKKSDLTGSVTSVSVDELTDIPNTSVVDVLQGKAAGVQIMNSDPSPGGGTSVRIRGHAAILTSNDPLYVIDGYVGASLELISPQDIASIEILKDASATAIYGARGGNGVVLITTKSGTGQKSDIAFSHSTSIKSIYKPLELMNAREYMEFVNTGRMNDGLPIVYTDELMNEVGEGTNWQKELYETGNAQIYNLQITTGNENTSLAVLGTYNDEKGIISKAGYQRMSARINASHRANKFIKFSGNLSGSRSVRNSINTIGRDGWDTGPVSAAMQYLPIIPVKTENGDWGDDGINDNPIAAVEMYERIYTRNTLLGNASIDLNILPSLTLKSNLGGDISNRLSEDWDPVGMQAAQGKGEARVSSSERYRYVMNSYLTFQKDFNDNSLSIMGGIEQEVNNYADYRLTSSGFFNNDYGLDRINLIDFESGGGFEISNNPESKSVLKSYFGRVNYNFRDKYLVTGTYRIDGSSKFGENNKYGQFPSGAVAWKLHNEDFIRSMGVFDELKLRASWGRSGNDRINPYQSIAIMQYSGGINMYLFGDNDTPYTGAVITNLPNKSLQWETSEQLNLGVDWGFFERRILLTTDLFRRTTSDLLWRTPLPGHTGYNGYNDPGTVAANIGKVRNEGLEIAVNTVNTTGAFYWTTGFNISFLRNEVLELGVFDIFYPTSRYKNSSVHRIEEGREMGNFYGYVTDGMWASREEIDNNPSLASDKPGDQRYADLNFDGRINGDDQTVIGNALPDFNWGLTNEMAFKNFRFSFLLNGVQGFDVYNANRRDLEAITGKTNMSEDVLNYYIPPSYDEQGNIIDPGRTNTDIPAPSGTEAQYFSDRFIEDGSFIRLSNVRLAYAVPSSLTNNILKNASVYVSGQNLYILTKYKGYDPEVSVDGSGENLTLGIDFSSYPQVRSITFGIDVKF